MHGVSELGCCLKLALLNDLGKLEVVGELPADVNAAQSATCLCECFASQARPENHGFAAR